MNEKTTVRDYRTDGYVNLMNRYGTLRDASEQYRFAPEPSVPDELLSLYYEGNGLFARIIDTPAEEAVKRGFTLEGLADKGLEDFCRESLERIDWEEAAMTGIRWARLYGGAAAVLLLDDGRGLEEPLDPGSLRGIEGIRVFDRSQITPDCTSVYQTGDPSRLGKPEHYDIFSRTGRFRVHDSRCLLFRNGILPEQTPSQLYRLWGVPEYVRIHRAIRDAEVAHGSATKLLDRSVQAVYRMKDLSAELATEEGEDRVLRRLQIIDAARGLLNSIAIDGEGEDYGFQQFQYSGVGDVIDATCNYLSALTSIPQTILFGRSPAGMNATGTADLENWYNYLERIQRRMLRGNLQYLLKLVFQAGVNRGEIEEVPGINVRFRPLWSLSEGEQATLEKQRASAQLLRAQAAKLYLEMGAITPEEVRAALAGTGEFNVETMLDPGKGEARSVKIS